MGSSQQAPPIGRADAIRGQLSGMITAEDGQAPDSQWGQKGSLSAVMLGGAWRDELAKDPRGACP